MRQEPVEGELVHVSGGFQQVLALLACYVRCIATDSFNLRKSTNQRPARSFFPSAMNSMSRTACLGYRKYYVQDDDCGD